MKLQFEHWAGFKLEAGYYRHNRGDRYTLRIGRRAVSLLVDNTIDAIYVNGKTDSITPAIELAGVGAFGFVFGVAISTLL